MNSVQQKRWTLSQESFNEMLSWLDADRERAGKKYEQIRNRLIKIFMFRGCMIAEELADETIDRVAKKVHEIRPNYIGEPALYFYGVARNVHLEFLKKKKPEPMLPPADVADDLEAEYNCLEKCMAHLAPENRELVLEYYQEEKRAKIEHRKALAQRLGIALNALRIRALRIRARLKECMNECLNLSTS